MGSPVSVGVTGADVAVVSGTHAINAITRIKQAIRVFMGSSFFHFIPTMEVKYKYAQNSS
jgi:hypothetical protein